MGTYLKRVLELTRPYRGRLILGLLCGFLSGILAPTLPLSLTLAVNAVFQDTAKDNETIVNDGKTNVVEVVRATTNDVAAAVDKSSDSDTEKKLKKVKLPSALRKIQNYFQPKGPSSNGLKMLVIALIPGFFLLRGVIGYLNIYLLSWVAIRAANDLRVKFFAHLIHLPMSFFNKNATGDLMARMDASMAMTTTISGSFGTIIREPIQILALVIFMIGLDPWLTLYTLVVFPVCLVPVIIYGKKLRNSHKGFFAKFSGVSTVMHETFTSARVVKAYNLEEKMVGEFRRAVAAVTGFFMKSTTASELPGPLIEFIASIGVALVFVHFAFFTDGHADQSKMLGFFFAVFNLYAPFKNLSRLQSQITQARASVDPVFDLLDVKTTLVEPANPKPLNASGQPIRFQDVTFAYDQKPVLKNISFTIEPGQFVGLVGHTGSGKTSIISLLMRFYDPTSGAVLIGDTDIRTVRSQDLRANMGVVTQDTILFNDSIRANIELGRPGATNAEIEDAAKQAHAHEFITEKTHGYNDPVGEKGANVSGGQRQRLAIARAVLKNAPILILDEATNSLDPKVERQVQEALEEVSKGRTTICIAHRLSTVRNADRILVMDNGRIVETGTHEELIALRGVYWNLYQIDQSQKK